MYVKHTVTSFALLLGFYSLVVAYKYGCTFGDDGTLYDCSNLNLTFIPTKLPDFVQQIDLRSNGIMEIPNRAFVNIQGLIKLDLSRNNISMIRKFAFENLFNLTSLALDTNRLTSLSFEQSCFLPLTNLQTLSIDDNKFSKYPVSEIQHLENLQELSIDIFEGFNFSMEFKTLRQLEALKLYGRDAFFVYNNSFEIFSNMNISTFELYLYWGNIAPMEINILNPFSTLNNLIIFSNSESITNILKLFYPLQHNNIQAVDISGIGSQFGSSKNMGVDELEYLLNVCIDSLNVADNGISSLPWLRFAQSVLGQCIQSLDVSNNPIPGIMDTLSFSLPFFKTLKNLNLCCLEPCVENKFGGKTQKYKSTKNVFFPPHLSFLDLSENKLSFFAGDVYSMHANNLKIINLRRTCSNICNIVLSGLTVLETLYITDSNCSVLHPHFIRNISNLRVLEIKNSFLGQGLIKDPMGSLLKGLSLLEYLNLADNEISFFHQNALLDQSGSLKVLKISGNVFTEIPEMNLRNIKTIDFRNNKLTTINSRSRSILENLNHDVRLYLEGNPIICTCETLDFLRWLAKNKFRIYDIENVTCTNSKISLGQVILQIKELERECSLRGLIAVSVSIGSSLVVIVCFVLFIYVHRIRIEYWRWRLIRFLRIWVYRTSTYTPLNPTKYHAFVCYSSVDSSWVKNNIVDVLESEYSLSVCVYDRDFDVGPPIVDCIIDAVEQSEKIIFVISKHFLGSEWGEFEMEIARMHAIKTKDRVSLIVILKENIEQDEMPRQLQRIWYKINCIKWLDAETEDEKKKCERKLYKALRRHVEHSTQL